MVLMNGYKNMGLIYAPARIWHCFSLTSGHLHPKGTWNVLEDIYGLDYLFHCIDVLGLLHCPSYFTCYRQVGLKGKAEFQTVEDVVLDCLLDFLPQRNEQGEDNKNPEVSGEVAGKRQTGPIFKKWIKGDQINQPHLSPWKNLEADLKGIHF